MSHASATFIVPVQQSVSPSAVSFVATAERIEPIFWNGNHPRALLHCVTMGCSLPKVTVTPRYLSPKPCCFFQTFYIPDVGDPIRSSQDVDDTERRIGFHFLDIPTLSVMLDNRRDRLAVFIFYSKTFRRSRWLFAVARYHQPSWFFLKMSSQMLDYKETNKAGTKVQENELIKFFARNTDEKCRSFMPAVFVL